MRNLSIEIAKFQDFSEIFQLFGQPDMSPGNFIADDKRAALFDSVHSNPCHELYVVRKYNEIVGTFSIIFVQVLSHNGAGSLVIEDVVVKAGFQGHGIGRTMMEFAIARGREKGCYKIALSSGEKRTEAHLFYESLGFRKHGVSFLLPIED